MTAGQDPKDIAVKPDLEEAGWLARNWRYLSIGLICLMAVGIYAVVRASAKPELIAQGTEELDKRITELAGKPVEYEIVSVQKSVSGSEDAEFTGEVYFTGQANAVSGCPQGGGGKDLWCVVLDREIAAESGKAYSHFLVQHLGAVWQVEGLLESEEAEFEHAGCGNWDAES